MRPLVICHMMPSVDGRLRTDRWDIPEKAHDEYERTADSFRADAWICGRMTMEEFAKGRSRPSRSRSGKIPRTDFIVPKEKGKSYAVAVDTHGKLAWGSNEAEGDPIVEVLTTDIPDGYLAFLREKGISYLFAGSKSGQPDLSMALQKLREKFDVRTLLLEGGGETNGEFLRAGLIDELSLLITPVADGGVAEPALFDLKGEKRKKALASLTLKSVRKIGADMVWIRYAVRRGRASRGRRAAKSK